MATKKITVTNSWYHNGGWKETGTSVSESNPMLSGWNFPEERQMVACIAFQVEYAGVKNGHKIDFSMTAKANSSTRRFQWRLSTEASSSMLPSGYLSAGSFEHSISYENTGTVSFSINDVSIASGTTYYLYIWGNDSNSQISIRSLPEGTFIYTSTTPVTNPTSISLSASSIYADGSITISWSGASNGTNNNIKHYQLVIRNPGKRITTPTTTNSFYTIKATEVNALKGDEISVTIQSIGSSSDVSNPTPKVAGSFTIINKPPSAPSYTTSGVISAQKENTSIIINSLNATDVDGDGLTYYYKISDSSSAPSFSGSSLITNGTSISMTPTNKYLYIWSYDGAINSLPTRKLITVNTPPVINSITIIPQLNGNQSIISADGNIVTERISCSASISKDVSSYTWEIEAGKEPQKISTQASFSNLNILNSVVRGEQIKIKLTVIDSVGDSDTYTQESEYYVMDEIFQPNLISIQSDRENEKPLESDAYKVANYYINTKMAAKIAAPMVSGKQVPLKTMQIYAKDSDGQIFEMAKYTPTQGEIKTVKFTYEKFSYDKTYTFFAKVTDNANRMADSIISSNFTRLPLIPLGESDSAVNPKALKLFYNENLTFSTLYINEENKGLTTYEIYGSINNKPYVLLDSFNSAQGVDTVQISGETIHYSINGNENIYTIYKKMGQPTSQDWSINYRIIAYNAFGISSTSYATISGASIITQEKPILKGTLSTKIYYKEEEQALIEATQIKEPYMVNPGEIIQFSIDNPATDVNEKYFDGNKDVYKQELKQYEVEYCLSEEQTNYPSELKGWKLLSIFSPYETQDSMEKLTSWNYTLSTLNNNRIYFYSRIRACDQTNKYSDYLYSTELIYCRKSTPVFSISSIDLAENSNENFILKYTIQDFGGNDFGFENFVREQSDDELSEFFIRYGSTLDQLNLNTSKPYQTKDLKKDSSFQFKIDSTFAMEQSEKIFFEVTLKINTNSTAGVYNQISSVLPVYIFYLQGPTVSHRPHWVGINTTDYKISDEDDAFHVASFENRKYISFSGETSESNSLVRLNLNTGCLFGIVINCGSWDSADEDSDWST